jgi:tetratricopeptide (TPR) repeat protein
VTVAAGTVGPVAAQQASPNGAANASSGLAGTYIQQGEFWLIRGRYETALQAFDTALREDPSASAALFGRGQSLVKLQRFQDAIGSLDEYLKKGGPGSASLYQLRGLVETKLGQYPRAIDDFTLSLTLQTSADTYRQRGWAYLANQAPKPALADFTQALRMDPKDADAYTGRGLARLNFGQYVLAVADAEAAVRQDSATPRLLLNAARIYSQASGRLRAEAQRDKRLQPPECLQYRDRSVQMLRQALERVPAEERPAFWREHLHTSNSFDPVRPSPQFEKLQAEVNRAAKPQAGSP